MAGRRYFQRGHASVPAAHLSSGFSAVLRPAAGLATLATGAILVFLFSSCVARNPTDVVGLASATGTAQPPAPSAITQQPSLFDSALAKVQDATHQLSGNASSGLQARPLSGEALQEVLPLLGQAEARLIDIYRLISQGQHREALLKASVLVEDHPNFHLAHLVHGDLLSL